MLAGRGAGVPVLRHGAVRLDGPVSPAGTLSPAHGAASLVFPVWRVEGKSVGAQAEPGSLSVLWKRDPVSDAVRAPGSFPKGCHQH